VRIESGDFFKELPSGADAIVMKHILHDWDDDSATRILQTCHRALAVRGKVLIVDPVVPPRNVPIMASCSIWKCLCSRRVAVSGR
jgi:predicted SAM-dependent methyltransferase